jgi:hypothetical protein
VGKAKRAHVAATIGFDRVGTALRSFAHHTGPESLARVLARFQDEFIE